MEVVLVAVSSAAYAGLGILGSLFTFAPGGVTLFYLPAIFMYAGAVWFGAWSVLGAFFGTLIFAPYFGYGFLPAIPIGIADMMSPLLVGLLVRRLIRSDRGLAKTSSVVIFAVVVALGAVIESVLGELALVWVGLTTYDAVPWGALIWWTGDVSAGVVFGPMLLRSLTGFLQRSGLYYESFLGTRQGSVIVED
jgi:integral membrane sensor domain MASE1